MDLFDLGDSLGIETVPFQVNDSGQSFPWDVPLHIVHRSEWCKECSTDCMRLPIQMDCSVAAFQQLLGLLETGDWSGVTDSQVQQLVEQYQLDVPEPIFLQLETPDLLETLYSADSIELKAHLEHPDLEIKSGINALLAANEIADIVMNNKNIADIQGILNITPKHPLLVRRLRELSQHIWAERRDIAAQFFKILGQY
jgi:hypothetical protein